MLQNMSRTTAHREVVVGGEQKKKRENGSQSKKISSYEVPVKMQQGVGVCVLLFAGGGVRARSSRGHGRRLYCASVALFRALEGKPINLSFASEVDVFLVHSEPRAWQNMTSRLLLLSGKTGLSGMCKRGRRRPDLGEGSLPKGLEGPSD